jgi:hypothetical protein
MEGFLVHLTHIHNGKKLLNEKGQSAIEFILVIGFALGITFLFTTQAMNATKGYLVHYANFAASRVYLVHDGGSRSIGPNYSGAESAALDHMDSFNLTQLFGLKTDCSVEKENALFTGTVCRYDVVLNFFPMIAGGDKAKLVTESFLGKEPLRATCFEMTCQAITGDRNGCQSKFEIMDITLYDNGC